MKNEKTATPPTSSAPNERDRESLHEKFTALGLRGYWQPRPDHHVMQPKLWRWHRHANLSKTEPAILFSVTDRPVLEMTGLDREEIEN